MPEPPRSISPDDLDRTETGPTVAGNRVSLSRHVAIARGDAIDRYEVRGEIGAGGVGVVLEAFDPDLGRRVAIKLLQVRRTGDPEAARAMMLREGQAIAQLSHPNVVSVFDVGKHGDEMFIAMEYVDGDSLKERMAGGAKPWREVVPLFLQAGRGLAAAHDVGIVHRDFKPSNVLVGTDGRVRVLDFGLARVFDRGEELAELHSGERILAQTLTVSGSIAGTPAYMSPEQYAGEKPDARSDMFSFCVALYEALAGRRPFAGSDVGELRANVLAGKLRPWPSGNETPRWLRSTIERGLAVDPADRYESMRELLDRLAHDPARTKHMVAVGALVAAALAAIVYLGLVRDRGGASSACSTGGDRIAAIWSDARKAELTAAFRATEVNHWQTSADTVARMLDERSDEWVAKHAEVCEATSAGEQSEAALDARMRCMDRRALELESMVDRLLAADAELVDQAIKVAGDLSGIGPCDDVDNLLRIAPLPDDAEQRARIEAIQQRLESARVSYYAGNAVDARAELEGIVADAKATGFSRLIADATYLRGRVAMFSEAGKSEPYLVDAVAAAAAARDAHLEAHASVSLLRSVSDRTRNVEEVRQVERAAKAAVARAGDDPELAGRLLGAQALMADRVENDLERASELARQAHEQLAAAVGERSLRAVSALMSRSSFQLRLGKLDEAVELARGALAIEEELVGPDHPELSDVLFVIGRAEQQRGNLDVAVEYFERALANSENRFGPGALRLGTLLQPLASAKASQGKFDVAIELLERAIALDPDDPNSVSGFTSSLGRVYAMSGDLEAALAQFERSLAATEQMHGADSDHLVIPLINLGMLAMNMGDDPKAETYCSRGIAILDATLGADNQTGPMAVATTCLAGALINQGEADRALVAARRAVTVVEARNADPAEVGQARFGLARAQFMTGDRATAIATAKKARAEMASAQRPPSSLPAVDAWIANPQ